MLTQNKVRWSYYSNNIEIDSKLLRSNTFVYNDKLDATQSDFIFLYIVCTMLDRTMFFLSLFLQ